MDCHLSNLIAVPLTFTLATFLSEIHEQLQAESHIASISRVLVSDCNLTFKNWTKSLASVWETTPEVSSEFFHSLTFEVFKAFFGLCSRLCDEIFSLSSNKTLWALKPLSVVHLFDVGHCRNECCLFRHKKRRLSPATTFGLCVGVFPQNTGQCHTGCFSWQTIHPTSVCARALRPTLVASALDYEANTCIAVFVLVIVGEI